MASPGANGEADALPYDRNPYEPFAATPKDIAWTDAAEVLGLPAAQHPMWKKVKASVVFGAPRGVGSLFTIRLSLPAWFVLTPVWPFSDTHLTVIKGTLYLGTGFSVDPKKAKALPPGSYALVAAERLWWGLTKEETVIQIHAEGPFGWNQIEMFASTGDPRWFK